MFTKKYLLLVGILIMSFIGSASHADVNPISQIGVIFQSTSITFYTTEEIPGLKCSGWGDFKTNRRYKCTCNSTSCFTEFLQSMYNTTFFLTLISSVLMLVVWGIMISVSGVDTEMKSKAKSMIIRIIIGILVLALIPLILTTVAPWIFN